MAGPNKSSAALLDDTQSRLWLQTKTHSGQEWDQVLGVSQRIINANFEQLFQIYPEMSDMYNSDDQTGIIDAKLLAPQVLIPGGNSSVSRSELLFQLRFESGSMLNSNGDPLIEDLSGWVITAPVKIDKSRASVTADMNAAAKDKVKRENDWIERFDVAGDYSAERLYAKLSSIRWHNFDTEYTTCGKDKDGKDISFRNWAADDESRFLRLQNWLSSWAYNQERLQRNNIGVKFEFPQDEILKKDTNIATYKPLFMMNQTYPYISYPQQAFDGATGPTGAGACNAYLYTEIVKIEGLDDKRRPDDHTLVWSGNFCTLPKTADGKGGIDGTFVMGRKVFLETFLLPELWALNKATDICHGKPYATQEADNRMFISHPYTLGEDPLHMSPTDAVFKFSNVNEKDDPEKVNGYTWRKINVQGPEEKLNTVPNACDVQMNTRDEMDVDVTWEPGSKYIKIAGKAVSKEDFIWRQGWATPKSWDKLWAWLHDKYTASWEITLELGIQPGKNGNGILDIFVKGGNENTGTKVIYEPFQHNIEVRGDPEGMKNQITDNFTKVIPTMIKNLKEKIEKSGRFVFPGDGVFNFSDPMMSKYGHLLTKLDYKVLKRDEKLFVPRAPRLEKPVAVKPPTEHPVMTPNKEKFYLEWTRINGKHAVPVALQRSRIWLRGANVDPIRSANFKQVILSFTSGSKGVNLFTEDAWLLSDDPHAQQAKAASPDNSSNAMSSSSGTASTAQASTPEEPIGSERQKTDPSDKSSATTAPAVTATTTEIERQAAAKDHDAILVDRPPPVLSASSPNRAPTSNPMTKTSEKATSPITDIKETGIHTPSGIVTLRQKISGDHKAILKPPKKAGVKWTMLLDTEAADGVLRLAPGDWVEVEWEGNVGPAGSYAFTINEDYYGDQMVVSNFKANVEIGIAAAE